VNGLAFAEEDLGSSVNLISCRALHACRKWCLKAIFIVKSFPKSMFQASTANWVLLP